MLKTIGLEPSAAIGGRHVKEVIGELPLVVHRGGARSLSAVHPLPECRNPNLSSSLARIGAPNGSFNRISKHSLLSLSLSLFSLRLLLAIYLSLSLSLPTSSN